MTQLLQRGEVFRDEDGNEYLILEILGEGNMAIVYLACPPNLPLLRYAIKTVKFPPQIADDVKAEFLRCFHRERQIMEQVAQLRHPHIAALYSSGMGQDGVPYIILEQLEGETLHARLQRGAPLPFSEALQITIQIGAALTAIHALDIVHRDLSTRNVFLCRPSSEVEPERSLVKLIDFGVAKFAGSTLHPGVYGSPAYMSPEQAAGSQVIDVRADQFVLAALLLEMLTGQPVFAAPAENPQEVLVRVQIEDPGALIAALPIPPAARRALAQALHKDPRQRFRSVDEFVAALQSQEAAIAKGLEVAGPLLGGASAPVPLSLPGLRSYLLLAVVVSVCGLLAYKTSMGGTVRGQSSVAARNPPPQAEPPAAIAAPPKLQADTVQAAAPPVTAVVVEPPIRSTPIVAAPVPAQPAPAPPAPAPPQPAAPLKLRARLAPAHVPLAMKLKAPTKSTGPTSSGGTTQLTWRAEPRFSNKSTPQATVNSAAGAVSQCLEKQRLRGRLPQDCTMTLMRSRSQGKYLMNDTDCEIRSYEFAMSLEICVSDNVRSRAIDPPPDSIWIQIYPGASQ